MHYLVRLIVEAKNATEAEDEAGYMMDRLVDWQEFDWYQTDKEHCRWAECWKLVRLNAKEGQAWVKDAMDSQLAEFERTMTTIRFMCDNYSNEDIFNEKFAQTEEHYLSRYQFSVASGYHGNACLLFGSDGSGITNQSQLASYMENWEKYWVVQVDAHN